jgi:glycogen operon protein
VLSQVKLIASRGTSAPAGTRSATSRCCGPSGTASIATRCAPTGTATIRGVAEVGDAHRGSNDLYERRRAASVREHQLHHRHDGFTLQDLVSFNDKHNEANGENNQDGESLQSDWNCGAEGPTGGRPASTGLREQQKRNLMASLPAVGGRADDQRRRRDEPDAAGQQQRLRARHEI